MSNNGAIQLAVVRRSLLRCKAHALIAAAEVELSGFFKNRRRRRWNVRPANVNVRKTGFYFVKFHLWRRRDPEHFEAHFRMTPELFQRLFGMVAPKMKIQHLSVQYRSKTPVSKEEALAMTIL